MTVETRAMTRGGSCGAANIIRLVTNRTRTRTVELVVYLLAFVATSSSHPLPSIMPPHTGSTGTTSPRTSCSHPFGTSPLSGDARGMLSDCGFYIIPPQNTQLHASSFADALYLLRHARPILHDLRAHASHKRVLMLVQCPLSRELVDGTSDGNSCNDDRRTSDPHPPNLLTVSATTPTHAVSAVVANGH